MQLLRKCSFMRKFNYCMIRCLCLSGNDEILDVLHVIILSSRYCVIEGLVCNHWKKTEMSTCVPAENYSMIVFCLRELWLTPGSLPGTHKVCKCKGPCGHRVLYKR